MMKTSVLVLALLGLSMAATPPSAQARQDPGWSFDPGVLAAGGGDLLRRAPDPQVDGLFQAVHAAVQDEGEAQALCALFEPGADRSLDGLNAAASRLGPDSRQRFAGAIADVLMAALQSPPQPFDAGAALQALKAAGATAAILHDGFLAGLNASGDDADSRRARCRSLRWLLDAMQARPQRERAAMTRWLLDQGLARLAPASPVSGAVPGT
jgi:hypothetical protein